MLPLIVCTSLLIMLVDILFGWYVEHGDESAFHPENGRLGVPVLYPVMPFSLTVAEEGHFDVSFFFHAT